MRNLNLNKRQTLDTTYIDPNFRQHLDLQQNGSLRMIPKN